MFTLVPGDRVWFFDDATRDEDDPCTYRGILRSITKNGLCEIQPISNYLKQDPTTLRIRQSDVYRDLDRWTTRFGVGDQVVCMTGGKGWIAGTITHLWPIWDIKQDDIDFYMPCYKLISSVDGGKFVVMADTDYHVTKRPLTFRFQLGDSVVFDTKKARCFSKCPSYSGWIMGVVVEVDVLSLRDGYAVYKCATEVDNAKAQEFYYIAKDVDEYIGKADIGKARDRFLESIEQGCSFAHLDFWRKGFAWICLLLQIWFGNGLWSTEASKLCAGWKSEWI